VLTIDRLLFELMVVEILHTVRVSSRSVPFRHASVRTIARKRNPRRARSSPLGPARSTSKASWSRLDDQPQRFFGPTRLKTCKLAKTYDLTKPRHLLDPLYGSCQIIQAKTPVNRWFAPQGVGRP
jgi:hypothetical protein